MTDEQPYLTVKQLAALVHRAPVTIYRMLKRGQIPATKFGGGWIFRRKDIDAWLKPKTLSKESKQALLQALPLETNGVPRA